MSTHPNVILLCTLTPDGLARKTYRDILAEAGADDDHDIKIGPVRDYGDNEYHHEVMESDYDESWQISAKAGDIIVFRLVTYGYGEAIAWDDLAQEKAELEEWAKGICERHHCSYKISVTANYW